MSVDAPNTTKDSINFKENGESFQTIMQHKIHTAYSSARIIHQLNKSKKFGMEKI